MDDCFLPRGSSRVWYKVGTKKKKLRTDGQQSETNHNNLLENCAFYLPLKWALLLMVFFNQSLCRFLRNCQTFTSIDKNIASAVIDKWQKHRWYTGGETIGFCLFSSSLSVEDKRLVRDAILRIPSSWDTRSIKGPEIDPQNCHISKFVDKTTKCALQSLQIDVDAILKFDPQQWESLDTYLKGIIILNNRLIIICSRIIHTF